MLCHDHKGIERQNVLNDWLSTIGLNLRMFDHQPAHVGVLTTACWESNYRMFEVKVPHVEGQACACFCKF